MPAPPGTLELLITKIFHNIHMIFIYTIFIHTIFIHMMFIHTIFMAH